MSQIVYGASVQLSIYLPEVLIATTVFSLHCGVYPLTFILIPEIMPEKVLEILFVSQIILEVKTIFIPFLGSNLWRVFDYQLLMDINANIFNE